MNVNLNSRKRDLRTRKSNKGRKLSHLAKAIIFAAVIYLFWLANYILNLSGSGRDNGSIDNGASGNTVPRAKQQHLDEFLNGNKKSDSGASGVERKDEIPGKTNNEKISIDIPTKSDERKTVVDPVHAEDQIEDTEEDAKEALANANDSAGAIVGANAESFEGPIRAQLSNFYFDAEQAQKAVDAFPQKIKTLTAYVEAPVSNEIPGTRKRGSNASKKDLGVPPKYNNPLPIRTTTPEDLNIFEYKKVDSCHNLQAKLPVDAGLLYHDNGERVFPNIQNKRFTFDYLEEAKYCPVDADPFLPWIHDIFPSNNGHKIHIIAQNKRRCNTGVKFGEQLQRLEPQVAIMQGISVKKLGDNDDSANEVASGLWTPDVDEKQYIDGMPRYRLATSADEADEDGKLTRFICRFHTLEYDEKTKKTRDVVIGETYSVFPINYEFVNLRKRKSTMLSPKGKDNGLFWLSNFRFECPVPDNGNLRESIASGVTVLPDGTPSIYVDIVPIRTNPRFGFEESYFSRDEVDDEYFANRGGRKPKFGNRTTFGFDAKAAFGESHVLPRVEASGRWANIPICTPPQPPPPKEVSLASEGLDEELDVVEQRNLEVKKVTSDEEKAKKPFTLISCLWASSTFHTRGGDRKVDDTTERMREWIEYNLMMGVDHIFVYDNSHANTNESDLSEALSPFSASEVTRIEWPSIVCNNNLPAHENTGERSSQYAAESSCRQRYGQFTDWIMAADTDEYFIPMGKYDNLKDVVRDAAKAGTNVLSFKSTRAYPNIEFTQKKFGGECGKEEDPRCVEKRDDATFLETYNCDFVPLPKPDWADRAKKQFYRPDYVLSHFVHYSTVTNGILETNLDKKKKGRKWKYWYSESKASERFTDELEEAVMIHSKTTVPGNTKNYDRLCKLGFEGKWHEKCRVGYPIPGNIKVENGTNPEGYELNCYTNEKVNNKYAPELREAMNKRTGRFLNN